MSNEVDSISGSFTQIVYQENVFGQATVASLSLLVYASALHFPDEIQYIWKPKFTVSNLLYLLAKYCAILLLIAQATENQVFLRLYGIIIPHLIEGDGLTIPQSRLCNVLGILVGSFSYCAYVGVQGLILLRTYSICQGYRPMTIALSITFLIPTALQIYVLTVPTCSDTATPALISDILFFISDIATILLDVLAFIGVIYQVWGIRKLRKGPNLQRNGSKSLVTSLFQQGALRICFVLLISTAGSVLTIVHPAGAEQVVLGPIQNALSAIIICEFTLALRRRNARKSIPNQSDLNLPTLSLPPQDNPAQTQRSVLGRIHESFLAEMGERDDLMDISINNPTPREEDVDDLQDNLNDANPSTAI